MQKGYFMSRLLLLPAFALLAAGCATVSDTIVLEPAHQFPSGAYAAQVAAVQDYEYTDSREPLANIEALVRSISGDPVRTKALADDLANLLIDPDSTYWAKDFACRQLWIIGGPEHVPHIASILDNPRTADMARYALENIRGPEADAALLASLELARNDSKIGIINTLGMRATNYTISDRRGVEQALKPYREARNEEVAAAARDALDRLSR